MFFNSENLIHWLSQYAYQPNVVYLSVVGIMVASGFGFPVPEEVSIISVGLLSYMGAHPELFPPPYPGAPVVHGYEAAAVTLLAVVATDVLVFSIGRIFGRKLVHNPKFSRLFSESRLAKINGWVKKYGSYAVFFFRFTPGIRFPAHIILGMSRIQAWQFAAVDGLAASISVPTQVLLIYNFGEPILKIIHKFKNSLELIVLAIVVIFILLKWVWPRVKPHLGLGKGQPPQSGS